MTWDWDDLDPAVAQWLQEHAEEVAAARARLLEGYADYLSRRAKSHEAGASEDVTERPDAVRRADRNRRIR